jgi:hypothetical protein
MTGALVLAGALLADGENKKSGPIGLAVILVLCVACYFLFKSMSKHLRKVREEFPIDAPPQGGELSPAPARPPLTKPLDPGPPGDPVQPPSPPEDPA